MSSTDHEQIDAQIELASALVDRGAEQAAANAFAAARSMCVSLCDANALAQVVDRTVTGFGRERESYRSLIAEQRPGNRRLTILADSLGLPRPDAKVGSFKGADQTYPFLLLERLPTHSVESHCQRYFTTREVLDTLTADPDLGVGDVVIHVGLNDCANRMFLETERLAMDLLPAATKEKVVGFAQRHRKLVLKHLPSYHYVKPDEFRSNLDAIFELLRQRGARRVVVATIILPPIRFWGGTPGIQRNFGLYNAMLMDAAARHGGVLFDLDRHVWSRLGEGVLLADGMHLSHEGHQMFADETAALLQ